ncbi:hypothetical protein [Mycolicibacterium thermoresistibile]
MDSEHPHLLIGGGKSAGKLLAFRRFGGISVAVVLSTEMRHNGGVSTVERDRLIRDLHRRGWSLRRIAQHPRVRLSHQGVANVLDRQARRAAALQLSALDLWRWSRTDPEAAEWWGRYLELAREMEAEEAMRRYKVPFADLDLTVGEALRRSCLARAIRVIDRQILAA